MRLTRIFIADVLFLLGLFTFVSGTEASSSKVATCSAAVLTVRVGAEGIGAGNVGTPFIISNHGAASCTLEGFPVVVAHDEAASPRPVIFVHRPRSLIYRAVIPRRVVLAHNGLASFGISFSDALDQQYGEGPRCEMNAVRVRFPGLTPRRVFTVSLVHDGRDGFGPINSCFAGFVLGLTPLVKGPAPPNY